MISTRTSSSGSSRTSPRSWRHLVAHRPDERTYAELRRWSLSYAEELRPIGA